MADLHNYDVQILDYTDINKFEQAFASRLNNGYILGGSNAYYDSMNDQQHYYAVFYYRVVEDTKVY